MRSELRPRRRAGPDMVLEESGGVLGNSWSRQHHGSDSPAAQGIHDKTRAVRRAQAVEMRQAGRWRGSWAAVRVVWPLELEARNSKPPAVFRKWLCPTPARQDRP